MTRKIGLIGAITQDLITQESGREFKGIGGILYQAAVLCALKKEVFLFTHLGEKLVSSVEKLTKVWSKVDRRGVSIISGSGNQVHLHYPKKGERIEILKSVVPPLNPSRIISDTNELDMLVMIFNSGFDIEFDDWRELVAEAKCQIWLDIHSLPLERILCSPRKYLPFSRWNQWAPGVSFLQANKKEVASMLGHPDKMPSKREIDHFGRLAFEVGVKAVFITLGEEGARVMVPGQAKSIEHQIEDNIVDTTGCGDVFCAATAAKLAEGFDPFQAASFGLHLATGVTQVTGIAETYDLIEKFL